MNYSDYFTQNSTPRHKVFISYHHQDQYYKDQFEEYFGSECDSFVSRSVSEGDIDTYLRTETIRQKIRDEFIADATVMIVLIGNGTWRRKHVDWEIGSGLRDTKYNSRTGLIGILLPNYSSAVSYPLTSTDLKFTSGYNQYNPYTIPPRLHDNVECGFAKIYSWPNSGADLRNWVHEAFNRREFILPWNSRDSFSNNRSTAQAYWRD